MVRALSSALFSLLPFGCELLKNALHVTCCLAPEKSLQKPTQASARNKSSTLKLPYQLKTDEDCHLTLGAAGEKKNVGAGRLICKYPGFQTNDSRVATLYLRTGLFMRLSKLRPMIWRSFKSM